MNRRLADLEHAEAAARYATGDDMGTFIEIHADPETRRFCPQCMQTATGSVLDDAPVGSMYRIGVVGPSTFVRPIVLTYAMAKTYVERLIIAHTREVGTVIGVEVWESPAWQLYAVIPTDAPGPG